MLMNKGSLFFFTITLFSIVPSVKSYSQRGYVKNPHVVYNVRQIDGNYEVSYTFKDQFDNFQTYELTMPAEFTESEISVFGVPTWLFEPYNATEYNLLIRQNELKKGLFELNGNTIEADKSAVISRYAETFCKPIAKLIVQSLEEYGRDNRRDRIEMTIRFVQDIPYGIPKYSDKTRHYGGVSPPPALFKNGYGDCDSKALLFAGILIYLIPGSEIIFLNQTDHVLCAVRGEAEEGMTWVSFKGKSYLVAEIAGPGKRMLGEQGDYFRNKFTAESLKSELPDPLPFNPDAIAERSIKPVNKVDEDKVIITNLSSNYFRFQLGFDKTNWKDFTLQKNESGIFSLEDENLVFLRFKVKNKYFSLYELSPGNSYSFRWNSKSGTWEAQKD